jgi:hypothetical protein
MVIGTSSGTSEVSNEGTTPVSDAVPDQIRSALKAASTLHS